VIATQPELDALLQELSVRKAVAVDCEMDSMYAYRTSLCLVQIGWEGGEALIDALAPLRRDALGVLFADRSVLKVFHGGENDVGLMRAHWGFDFENVFDTMAASQVLGADGVGLQALLLRHFNVHVSKKFQKADWRVRPLPPDQAEYAKMDVRYLLPLHGILDGELGSKGRRDEAHSEFRRIARARIEERPFDPDNWVRIKGARELPVDRRGALRELYIARDELARQLDRAPYRVLNESVLVDLAFLLPDSPAALKRVAAAGRHLRPQQMDRLLEAVARGREVTDLAFPRSQRPGPADRFGAGPLQPEQVLAFDALRAWRQRRADSRGVNVARVATNQLLSAIARANPASPEELAAVEGMEDWRLLEYGDEILKVLREPGGANGATAS
jgi:ribonuclease D